MGIKSKERLNRHYVEKTGEELMPASRNKNKPSSERLDLDRRYGEIGISAVAAALRYRSDAKNPAYAPVASQPQDEREDVAA
jgi:hypothetical protein